jgi:hypothetical protein
VGDRTRGVRQVSVRDRGRALIISAGLNGSGSTWAFNLIAAVLERGAPDARIHTLYSDLFLDDVLAADADTTIVKTHRLPAAVRTVAALLRVPIVLTVRDPKDGVASLVSRFGFDFDEALEQVRQSAEALAPLGAAAGILTFRYEDGYTRKRDTVDALAGYLGVALRRDDRDAIWDSLTPDAVRATIDELAASGVFAEGEPAAAFDLKTHWHPGHVGDGRVGTWRTALDALQAARVDGATEAFRAAFGYGDSEPAVRKRSRRRALPKRALSKV